MKIAILIETDGFSITTTTYSDVELARIAMKGRFNELNDNDDDSNEAEMSYVNDLDAMLYTRYSNVYVWHIENIDTENVSEA